MMKKILFVCVENSNRSQMAEAFAKIHGKRKIEAYSSGSRPSGIINPKAIAAMKELGYDLTTHDSKSLDEIPQIKYDYAITMGCGDECPFVKAEHRDDWQLDDPKYLEPNEFNKVRDEIEKRVKKLIDSIYGSLNKNAPQFQDAISIVKKKWFRATLASLFVLRTQRSLSCYACGFFLELT